MENVRWYPKKFARENEGVLFERVSKSLKTRLYSNCIIIGGKIHKIAIK